MALPSFTFTIPRFKLPAFVSAVGNKLPQWPHALVLVTGLNAVLKMKLLPQDSLDLLEGRSFLVDVLDTGGRACFTYQNGLFRPLFTPRKRLTWPSAPTCRPSSSSLRGRKTRTRCSSTASCRSKAIPNWA